MLASVPGSRLIRGMSRGHGAPRQRLTHALPPAPSPQLWRRGSRYRARAKEAVPSRCGTTERVPVGPPIRCSPSPLRAAVCHPRRPQRRVRGRHAVVPDQVQPRPRHDVGEHRAGASTPWMISVSILPCLDCSGAQRQDRPLGSTSAPSSAMSATSASAPGSGQIGVRVVVIGGAAGASRGTNLATRARGAPRHLPACTPCHDLDLCHLSEAGAGQAVRLVRLSAKGLPCRSRRAFLAGPRQAPGRCWGVMGATHMRWCRSCASCRQCTVGCRARRWPTSRPGWA